MMFGVCFGVAQGALTFAAVPQNSTAIWPASGLALAAALLLGSRIWPAVAAGVFAAHVAVTGDVLTAATIGLATSFEAVAGAALTARAAADASVFRSPIGIFRFTAITVATCALGAAIVAIGLVVSGTASFDSLVYIWLTSWLSHVTGILVVAPFVLLWLGHRLQGMSAIEALEATGLFALLLTVSLVVFGGLIPSTTKTYPLEFLCLPTFLWIAFRFGRREMATANLILSVIAVRGTLLGMGPFAQPFEPHASLVLLQAYISVMSLVGLVLAAVVAEHKRAEAQLHELATTDPLTGLANYRELLDALRFEIARSGRTGRKFAVLFLDMDGLKAINDEYGHLIGSRALCRVGDTLRRTCRAMDTSARYGGDEFAVILPETSRDGARAVLDRISERLALDTTKPAISVSGGVALYPDDGDTPTLLLRAADTALYAAKNARATARPRAVAIGGNRATG
jgi:diguanylate cyclase